MFIYIYNNLKVIILSRRIEDPYNIFESTDTIISNKCLYIAVKKSKSDVHFKRVWRHY